MANPLFGRFGMPQNMSGGNMSGGNLIAQFAQLKNNPGMILDILLKNGKINQAQYNELSSVRNDPQKIFEYLVANGNSDELNRIKQMVSQIHM